MPSNSHQNPTSYDCSLCNRQFASSGSLARHMKASHPTPACSLPEDSAKYVRVQHSYLTGKFTFPLMYQHELTSNCVSSTMCRGWFIPSQSHPRADSRKTT